MNGFIQWLSNTLGARLATVIGSFLPLIELKGSIMFARGASLGFFEALGLSYIGSTAIFFALFFLLKPFLALLKKTRIFKKFAVGLSRYVTDKANKEIAKREKTGKNPNFIKAFAVCVFVAIPLPMTGVWTGTAIAVFVELKFRDAFLAVAIGNFGAGLIISVLAELFLPYVDIILYSLFAIALVLFVIFVIKIIKNANKVADGEESI